jgi:16S rRNA (guanine527-N7)-methyltransferase
VPAPPTRALDLGSGGGLPGLPLALRWTTSQWVLLDANERRTAWLGSAVQRLDLTDRVEVVRGRAETVGHERHYRATCDLVTARGFGPPPVTAECAAPFLAPGGSLVVSEPPNEGNRWPPEGVRLVGLRLGPVVTAPFRMQVLTQEQPCPGRYPRRVGVPAKRPLFRFT